MGVVVGDVPLCKVALVSVYGGGAVKERREVLVSEDVVGDDGGHEVLDCGVT